MKSLRCFGATLALLVGLSGPLEARDPHKEREKERAIGAAIGLAIVGIAAAASKNKSGGHGLYERRYDDSYMAAPDVICYRGQRQCFRNGYYSNGWTSREFGYDSYGRGY